MQCWPLSKDIKTSLGIAYIEFIISTSVLLFLGYLGFATVDWTQKNETLIKSIDSALHEMHVIPFGITGGANSIVSINSNILHSKIVEITMDLYERVSRNFKDVKGVNIFIYGAVKIARIDPISGNFLGFDPYQYVYTIGYPTNSYIDSIDRIFNQRVSSLGVSLVAIPLSKHSGSNRYFQNAALLGLYAAVDIKETPASYIAELMNVSSVLEYVQVIDLRGGIV